MRKTSTSEMEHEQIYVKGHSEGGLDPIGNESCPLDLSALDELVGGSTGRCS
jgi:hypothetical protein